MKNVQDIVNSGRCIGCGVCYAVCINGYIEYRENGGLGFPVPQVSKCDGCSKCLGACPSSDLHDGEDDD